MAQTAREAEKEADTAFYVVIYKSVSRRAYGWRCRERGKDYERADDCCARRWGIRSAETARRNAEEHIRARHGGGIMWLSYEKDPETNVWRRLKIE